MESHALLCIINDHILPSTGSVFCTVVQANWVIIRSLQCFLIKLLATCTHIMLILMHRTDSQRSQKTEAIPRCMGFSSHMKLYNQAESLFFISLLVYINYISYFYIIFYLQNRDLLDTLQKIEIHWGYCRDCCVQCASYWSYKAFTRAAHFFMPV
jgi:hypothetical protein